MSTDTAVKETHDDELVELSGYYAYRKLQEDDVREINDKKFEVIHTKYDTDSGLDALTVKNQETDQLTVVYVGSEPTKEDWLTANPALLTDTEPQQMEDAKEYFDDVNNEIGEVDSVAGNSLGGAHANAVAVDNPDVKAVTYNPAILPEGIVDPDKSYANITNYYGEHDPLTKAQEAGDLGDRVPGDHYTIQNGVPLPSALMSNHTGYTDKENGNFTVEIGTEGKPGHGHIHVGAGDHIATSLLTGESLHGSSSEVDIDKENIEQLADGLHSLAEVQMDNVSNYVDNSLDIVENESAKFDERITTMQEVFEQLIHDTAGDPLFKGITQTGDVLLTCIDSLISLLDKAEENCHFLKSILDSKPAELIEYVTSTELSVEAIFDPPRNHLNDTKDSIEDLVSDAVTFKSDKIPELLKDSKDTFVDAVVGELDAHYDIVQGNVQKLTTQISLYEQQIRGIGNAFYGTDFDLANSIESKSDPTSEIRQIPTADNVTMEESSYLEEKMKLKENQVDYAYGLLKMYVNSLISPPIVVLKNLVHLLELALEAILETVDAAKNVALHGNPASSILNLFTDFDEKVKEAAQAIKEPVEEMETSVEGVRKGLERLHDNLPELLEEFKPYLETAVFQVANYSNVRTYNSAATAVLGQMEVQFKDITNQLLNEKGEAIQHASKASEKIKSNLHKLESQVERGSTE